MARSAIEWRRAMIAMFRMRSRLSGKQIGIPRRLEQRRASVLTALLVAAAVPTPRARAETITIGLVGAVSATHWPIYVGLKQGYYAAQPENARKFLTEAEWDYWYGGKPAASDIMSPFGKLMEKAGNVRDGGTIEERLGNIAVWNSVMDEDRYLTRRWNEFITS